jgi:hypothetical protein
MIKPLKIIRILKAKKIPFCYAYYPNLLRVIINIKYIEIINSQNNLVIWF